MSWDFGGGLSSAESETLKYFKYNPSTNKLEALRTVSTEPSSIDVGNHTISSGGENVFFTNRTGDIDWFSSWTGVKDQSDVANQSGSGVIPPSFRHYNTDVLELEVDGVAAASGVVDYNEDSTVNINNSVFGQEVIVEEEILPGDWLFYEVRVGTSSDPIVYKQTLTNISLQPGQVLMWWFDHPVEGRAGTQINSSMKIAKGSQDSDKTFLHVRPTQSDPNTRYLKIKYRLFSDEDVMSGTIYTDASQMIRYAATYAADTTTAGINLTVNSNIGYRSFTVFDAAESFSPARKCTVKFDEGQGDAVLQTKNDSFLFYYVPTAAAGSRWRYLDLNTKSGGVV